MGWKRLPHPAHPKLLAHLCRDETLTVNATSLLLTRDQAFSVRTPRSVWTWPEGENGDIQAVLAVRGKSLFIPILADPLLDRAEDLGPRGQYQRALAAADLVPVIRQRSARHFNLMGPSRWVEPVEKVLGLSPYQRLVYDLMEQVEPVSKPTLPAHLSLEVIDASNWQDWHALQAAYEKEEVLFSPLDYDETQSRWFFEQAVHKDFILGLRYKGQPAAKAGTNARGRTKVQLGGVYTHPDFRRQGLGRLLVQSLLARLGSLDRTACLFVKQSNPAALSLYHSLGLRTREDFLLSYFERPGAP